MNPHVLLFAAFCAFKINPLNFFFVVFLTGHRDLFFLILISNILVGLGLINGLRESVCGLGKITEMNIPSCKHSALDVVTVNGRDAPK